MAELTFKSPGVSTREIDLSGPSRVGPVGTPAGVIGTSAKGRAFVPLVFANLSEFVAEFGAVGPDKFGPMALREWFSNARAGLYLKVLGVGDGKARLDVAGSDSRGNAIAAGAVKNAGFVVGSEIVNPDTGRIGANTHAGTERAAVQATVSIGVADGDATDHGIVEDDALTLVDAAGESRTYHVVNETNIAEGSEYESGTALADGQDTGAGTATGDEIGRIAVVIRTTAGAGSIDTGHEFLTQLKKAIESEAGHNGSIVVSGLPANPADQAQAMTLTQREGGEAGNTAIRHVGLPAPVQVNAVAIADVQFFSGGVNASGTEGRTHFLSVLMKENASVAATSTITKAGDVLPATGDSIKITTTDGQSVTYVIVHAANSNDATDSQPLQAGNVIEAGDTLDTGKVVAAGDHRIGGISVVLGDANATMVNLHAQIDAKQGSTASPAKLTVGGIVGDNSFLLTQIGKGRLGNTIIDVKTHAGGSSITGYTIPTFSGGVGERILTEAGSGVGDSSGVGERYANVLRGVLMYPSGVVPGLASSRPEINNAPVGKAGLKGTATAVITFVDTVANNARITLTDGTNAINYDSALTEDFDVAEDTVDYKGDGSAVGAATSFVKGINSQFGHAGKHGTIRAVRQGAKVTLVMTTPGAAGNRTITTDAVPTDVVVPPAFTGGADTVPQLAASSLVNSLGAPDFGVAPNVQGVDNGGSHLGNVSTADGKQEFVMILNGHKPSAAYPSALTASFDPQSSNYFPNVFNTDPQAIQTAGHYLHVHYDVFSSYATPAATSNPYLTTQGQAGTDIAFLLPTKKARNTGEPDRPNAESFSDRFRAAVSPTFISQKFGGINQPLFRIHSLDDGAGGNSVYKLTIENLRRSQSDKNRYGTFDLLVRKFDDNDREPVVLERYSSLNLDPNSERFISRIIGDQRLFYDFDKRAGGQKLTLSGKFANNSNYIRVEVEADVEAGITDPTALPFGFRGPQKLNIDNDKSLHSPVPVNSAGDALLDSTNVAANSMVAPPLPLRRSLAVGITPKKRVVSALNWGIQFEADDFHTEPNKNSKLVSSARSWSAYFPDFDQDSLSLVSARKGSAEADVYNNNKFTLENIQVVTAASGNPDSAEWAAASYRRDGVLDLSIKDVDGNDAGLRTRFLNTQGDLDLGSVRRYLKYNVHVAGGFDGVEIFDKEKATLSDVAVMREVTDSEKQGGKDGATAATYMRAIDVLAERSDVDIQLLAIPGIRQSLVTDRAIDAVEERFDAMYIMDAIVYDTENTVVTGSMQKVSVTNTVSRFNNRVLDTSFAAAYFPDVILSDPSTGQNIQVPPSVPVLGAFSLNDQLAHPWFAPAGFTRGAMANVAETQVKLNRDNLDSLYDVDINPITSFPHTEGVVVFGQKTLLRTQSSLDRVNVRRLLIELRRRVRRVANSFIFEPNREATLARFSARVNPILRQIQQQQGVDRFLVKIDTTTTTQTDVENNTLRGKIFLQPTRSVEFISLDFVITNAGAEI